MEKPGADTAFAVLPSSEAPGARRLTRLRQGGATGAGGCQTEAGRSLQALQRLLDRTTSSTTSPTRCTMEVVIAGYRGRVTIRS